MSDGAFFGSGKANYVKFPTIGASVTGYVAEEPTVSFQTDIKDPDTILTWPDGRKKRQLRVVLMTEEGADDENDDQLRVLFIKEGTNLHAVTRAALNEAGLDDLFVGTKVRVTYVADGVAKNRNFNPPKQYSVKIKPPEPPTAEQLAAPTPARNDDPDDAAPAVEPANSADSSRTNQLPF